MCTTWYESSVSPSLRIRVFTSLDIFGFNKFYLDKDPDEVAKLLHRNLRSSHP